MPKKKKQLKFGRYEVESELGQGAMGKVYKAFDPLTQRPVAIKALKHEILAQDESGEYQKRFQREARAAGGLSHPHIITCCEAHREVVERHGSGASINSPHGPK